jgi:hypothetical protein
MRKAPMTGIGAFVLFLYFYYSGLNGGNMPVDLVLFVSLEPFWDLTCHFWAVFEKRISIFAEDAGDKSHSPDSAENVANKSDEGRKETVRKVYARELLIACPTSELKTTHSEPRSRPQAAQ